MNDDAQAQGDTARPEDHEATPPRTARAARRRDAAGADQSASHIDTARAAPESEPRLPHERDETVGMTNQTPDMKMQRAQRDLAQGRVDTDRGPVTDRVYRQLKR